MAPRTSVHETPAMLQFRKFKQQHPDCVLFFRMGDFYETFYDDAKLAHKVLGVTLTQRTQGIPMAGVPYHSVEGYIRRMIQAGHRVAVCDQTEDAALAKGLVRREVTRVITPGTLTDDALLDESRENPLAAIAFHPPSAAPNRPGQPAATPSNHAPADTPSLMISLAWAELSTGEFRLMTLPAHEALDELARINPRELLYAQPLDNRVPARVQSLVEPLACSAVPRPDWHFRLTEAIESLCKQFQVATLEGFGLSHDNPALGPASAVLHYLLETQTPSSPDAPEPATPQADTQRPLPHLRPPIELHRRDHLVIDHTSLRSLEIERTLRTGETKGSLLDVLQRCTTAMGKRALRTWLCYPLCDIACIQQRQRAVAAIADDETLADQLAACLDQIQDVQRIASRIAVARATPRDLVALGSSTAQSRQLSILLADRPAFAHLAAPLNSVTEALTQLSAVIAAACTDSPPAHLREGGLIRDGYDPHLDEIRSFQNDTHAWLARYQKQLIEQTGIANLKVGFNKVFGYYIELTAANRDRAPDAWTRKQTLKNAERFITADLKEYEDKALSAAERAIAREQQLFTQLCQKAQDHLPSLALFADVAAQLDVLACFAHHARHHRYVQPTLVDEPVLDIRAGRHPVLDRILADRFVPNEVHLGPISRNSLHSFDTTGEPPQIPNGDPLNNNSSDIADTDQAHSGASGGSGGGTLALITGPNMAGKSTYIRQAALITLLAHTGCFVPADSAIIGLCDRIFTRVGASDELHAGRSTFMVEMIETAHICHHATPRSLVILDEIGRGTSTLDGLSLAWAIAEHLALRRPRTLFATHYHELTALAQSLPNVANLNVLVREWQDQIVFLHRIIPGAADKSYGIHVAQIAGLPQPVVARAKELLNQLEVSHTPPGSVPAIAATPPVSNHPLPPNTQLSLFTEYLNHPALDTLRQLNLDHLTPVQAFDTLRKLKEDIDRQ